MTQKQGNSTTSGGRLDGSIGTPVTTANFALGVGWGGAATAVVTTGSTDQRGSIAITASATTPAQATATVVLTFADGAYKSTPGASIVQLLNSTQSVADVGPTAQTCTTTALSWCSGVLPVSTKVYTYNWVVVQ